MHENFKPKMLVILSTLTFGINAVVMSCISPVERWLRLHPWPDKQLSGGHTNQYRQIGDDGPTFYLYLWSAEVACSSALLAGIVYFILLGHLVFSGFHKLVLKVRNPAGLHSQDDVARRREARNPSLKMIFFHPRVIISVHLLLTAATSVVAALGMYVSNKTSDVFDPAKAQNGHDLGAFTLETYTCNLLAEYARDNVTSAVEFHDKCLLMKTGRWAILAAAVVSVVEFLFGVWVLDSISQPVEPQSEHQRVRAWLEDHPRFDGTTLESVEDGPNIERVRQRF